MARFAWSQPTVSGTGSNSIRAMLNIPGTTIWVGGGDGGTVVRSTDDGATWASYTTSEANPWRDIDVDGSGKLVMVASSGTNRIAVSTNNGASFTLYAAGEANSWQTDRFNAFLNLWVSTAQSGTHRVQTAADPTGAWTPQTASSSLSWNGLAVNPSTGLMCSSAFGVANTMTSSDGSAWTGHSLTAGHTPTGGGNNKMLFSTVLSKFAIPTVSGGSSYWLSSSSDGSSWTDTAFTPTGGFGGQLVSAPALGGFIVPAGSTLSKISYSTDGGATWVTEDSGFSATWYAGNWNDTTQTVVFWDNNATGKLLVGRAVSFDSMTPTTGPTTGGTFVTLTGRGFTGKTNGDVTFDGLAATLVTVVSDTTITCNTPAHKAGSVAVTVAGCGTLA